MAYLTKGIFTIDEILTGKPMQIDISGAPAWSDPNYNQSTGYNGTTTKTEDVIITYVKPKVQSIPNAVKSAFSWWWLALGLIPVLYYLICKKQK
ncbi:MAG: hypothetical protein DI598_07510 [Pseudopedobacter saltans]|uniref:Uncharacterized protein n=1 Tax=Pseudopedobacter saltans TaxID=151895 RepID=A0A2W5F019_9SPHI|nr:MAG: hypothetical protein DI598_07510 [Pseudopedobacter saltans]